MSSLPSFLQRIEARFGLTRGDVTVALFLAGAALAGFVYMQFFEEGPEVARRTELLKLVRRQDSTLSAHEASQLGGLASLSDSDSVAQSWQPLSEEEVLEEGTDGSSKNGRSAKLTLKDVAPVNLNTAPPAALELLPGVGEKTAEKIVEYRQAAPFRRIEDIMNVKGIGPKKFAEMKPYITVGKEGSAGAGEGDDSVTTGKTNK